jgi:YbgC/YbaW family acyl-CoA thioester hydrolase
MRVRDYELDMFGVVNNGVYAHLFQDARHLALEKMTGTSVAQFLESGVLMALSELVVRYKAPLRSGDAYVCRVGVAEVRGTRVTLAQQVVRVAGGDAADGAGAGGGDGSEEAEVVAAEGSATVVFLDGRYRPARMPAEARRAFEAAFAEE